MRVFLIFCILSSCIGVVHSMGRIPESGIQQVVRGEALLELPNVLTMQEVYTKWGGRSGGIRYL